MVIKPSHEFPHRKVIAQDKGWTKIFKDLNHHTRAQTVNSWESRRGLGECVLYQYLTPTELRFPKQFFLDPGTKECSIPR